MDLWQRCKKEVWTKGYLGVARFVRDVRDVGHVQPSNERMEGVG